MLTAVLAAILAVLVVGDEARAAATPPYEPDPNSLGVLSFFDDTGNLVTGGSLDDAPFAAFVQSSVAVRAGDTKATLFGYLPKAGLATTAFTGEGLTASTDFPNAAAPAALASSPLPLVMMGPDDVTLAQLIADLPNTATDSYQGLYQLRVKTSAAGVGVSGGYASASILVSGTTWTQVYPEPGAPTSTTSTTVDGSSTTTSTTVGATTTTTTTGSTTSTTSGSPTTSTTAPGSGTTTTVPLSTGTLVVNDSGGKRITAGAVVAPGTTLVVQASGFVPGEEVTVTVHSAVAVALGSATADTAGNLTVPVVIPVDLPAGNHELVLLSDTTTATLHFVVAGTAVPQGTSSGSSGTGGTALPRTGGDLRDELRTGLEVLLVGAILVLNLKRRELVAVREGR